MVFKQVDVLAFPNNAEVKGIGKVVLSPVANCEFNIPHLHFLVFQEKGESLCEALNLEYGLNGQGSDPKKSLYDAIENVVAYFVDNQIDGREKFKELIEIQDNNLTADYWRIFRRTEMELALDKKDLGHSIVKKTREEAVQELARLATENKDLQAEIKKLQSFLEKTEEANLELVA